MTQRKRGLTWAEAYSYGLATVVIVGVIAAALTFSHSREPVRFLSPPAAKMLMTGDSIGVGIAGVLGINSIAEVGETHDKIAAQFENGYARKKLDSCWSGLVLASVGTNEASQGRTTVDVDAIVRAAKGCAVCWARTGACTNVTREVVIIGPPCVKRAWDKNSAAIDAQLIRDTAKLRLRYVSLRKFCNVSRDGVHPASYAPLVKHLTESLTR